ncbi:MAG TPA: MarR family transcriptional regulator [Dehalococcoidia bacterium]|nr:MarR family transcriptional regulator [Dehalococcoidia bacterium]
MSDDDPRVPASLGRFVERVGLYFEEFGLPRIAGRLFGLLLVADEPLSLEQAATMLHVSRASVSTNARLVVRSGLVERVSLPGDRRDYYVFGDRSWEAFIETDMKAAVTLREFADDALAGLGPAEAPAKARLEAVAGFFDFYNAELTAILEHWRARAAGQQARQAPPNGRRGRSTQPATRVDR